MNYVQTNTEGARPATVTSNEELLARVLREYNALRTSDANPNRKKKGKGLRMTQVLDLPSFGKFKDLLQETGLMAFLDDLPGVRTTLIAPVNEAFDSLDPSTSSALAGKDGFRLSKTLARTHIIAAPHLIREPHPQSLDARSNYDANGNLVEVDLLVASHTGDPQRRIAFLNKINGVRPLEPQLRPTIRTKNGDVFLIPELLFGEAFLAQKYSALNAWHSHESTLWEVIEKTGCTKFLKLAERVDGVKAVLSKPLNPESADFPSLLLPVNESFRRIDETLLENDQEAQILVKRHVYPSMLIETDGHYNCNLLGERNPKLPGDLGLVANVWDGVLSLGGGSRGAAANGNIYLYAKCLYPEKPGWNLEPIRASA